MTVNHTTFHSERRCVARVGLAGVLTLVCAACVSPPQDRQLWRFSTFDRRFWHGWCSATEPLIDGDRLYVGGGYAWWDRQTALWALNRHTGAIVWKTLTGDGFSSGASGGSHEALSLAGDVLLAGVGNGLGAFQASDGTRLWLRPSMWPQRATYRDTVYAVTESHLLALDLRTGDERWRFALDEPVASAPVVLGERVYLGASRRAALVAIDATSGREASVIDGLPGFNGSLATADGLILAGAARYGRPLTYVVDPASGTITQREALLVGLHAKVAYFAVAGGGLEAVDVATGRVTRAWSQLPHAADGGVLVDRDVFYQQDLRSRGGRIRAYDLDSGSRVWTFRTGDWVNGMALTPDALYLSSEDCGVYAVRPGR